MDRVLDERVRAAAFGWLEEMAAIHGDVLDGGLLRKGFDFEGHRIPLAVQQGIHKPRILEAALSLRTAQNSPYADQFDGEESFVYRYRGNDPNAWDNRAARLAMEGGLPLIYLYAVSASPPRYVVVRPVFIVADDPAALTFRLQAEPVDLAGMGTLSAPLGGASLMGSSDLTRRYGTRLARTRLHQATFRERVLSAYRSECAMCHFKHPKLLDAAHIIPDSDALGEPIVSNGMSLCRIHHGAFDVHYLSVEPNTYRIRVRQSLLEEEDGPMLRHGLQALDGVKLAVPRRISQRPDPERLRLHFREFESRA